MEIEKILAKEKKIQDVIDSNKSELQKTVSNAHKGYGKKIDRSDKRLQEHYRSNIKTLFEEVLKIMSGTEAPFEWVLLKRNDGMYKSTEQFSRFSMLRNSRGELVYTPVTNNWFDGWNTWNQHREHYTLDKLLEEEKTKPEDIVTMYQRMVGFIEESQKENS